MENYIVRIYRRDPDDSDSVTGMLESVEQETRRPFHTLDALRSMLDTDATEDLQPAGPTSTSDAQGRLSPVLAKSTRRFDH
jgi:hypothetical protein